MKFSRLAAAIGLLLLVAACVASSSRSDYDPQGNDRQGGFYGGVSGGWSSP